MKLGRVEITTPRLLALLAAMLVAMVLLTPEESMSGGGRSTYSTAPGGARIAFELAQRMGWRSVRRETPLDSATPSAREVQVVIGAPSALGAAETHRLLERARDGGGLIFSVDGGGAEIADSLGIDLGEDTYLLPNASSSSCDSEKRITERPSTFLPPLLHAIVWKRPAPGRVVPILESPRRGGRVTTVAGFTIGKGRAVVVSTSSLFANEAMRICTWGADVAAARTFEFMRPTDGAPTLVFDEFHHGYGTHGGSMRAVATYLARTPSGHVLAQALVAGLLLLFAAAPRPVAPREPERFARRSPLEHADALALAYMDVGASRTVASRLIDGLRRRTGRIVGGDGGSDVSFLDAVERRSPTLQRSVAVLRRALQQPVEGRDVIAIGDAIMQIEQTLTTTPPVNA